MSGFPCGYYMKIIAISDIHIRNLRRLDEYSEQLNKFVAVCKDIVKKEGKDNVRIVIAGDLVHNKTELSPECYVVASWFLRKLDSICTTIMIAGNHDITCNQNRLDGITSICKMCKFKDLHYLDEELDYQSGCVTDGDIVWCLYSAFDHFARPNIDEERAANPNAKFIGLFHGDLKNAKTDTGYVVENGLSPSSFEGLDFVIMGHIHKRQEINHEGTPLVYCGSLIQQNHGENIGGHGYIMYDTETDEYEAFDIENDNYGFYTFTIDSPEDIDNDKEEIINL